MALLILQRILVRVEIILEGKHVRDVALQISKEGLDIGVHTLLVQVVLAVLLLPRATPVAVCLLLCLDVTPTWNVTTYKTKHRNPLSFHDDSRHPNVCVHVLHHSL